MKKSLTIIATLFVVSINAQTAIFNPKSGDAEIDKKLEQINITANKDLEKFKADVKTNLNIPKEKTEELLQSMSPADVVMVAETANASGKPVDEVVAVHEKNKDKGWGATAKELGIKPGSKEFMALKGKVKGHGKPAGKGKPEGKGKSEGKGKGKGKSEEKAKSEGKDKSEEKGKSEEKDKSEEKVKSEEKGKSGGKGKGKNK